MFGFSLNLQAIEDSFGMSIIEAMQAGSVVVASPLGAYPEITKSWGERLSSFWCSQ